MSDDHALNEFIRSERVRFVFVQSPVPIFFSPVAASILSLALWESVDRRRLMFWTIGLLVIAVGRVLLIRKFPRTNTTEAQIRRWEKIFVSSILLVDLWWGIGGLFLLTGTLAERALVFVFMMLMASGHAASYAAHPATVLFGVLGLTVPITIHFALQPDTIHRVMAAAAILYLLALARSIKTLGYFFGHAHRLAHELDRLANTDFLTSLNNRRAFYELGEVAARVPASMLMLDIDHFKSINDRFGHAGGDAVIRAVATIIRESLRERDVAGRVGGEEFAVILRATSIDDAITIAEDLRAKVAESGKFTVSVGVAEIRPNETLEQWIARADAALYEAKEAGRNRVAGMLSRANRPGPAAAM